MANAQIRLGYKTAAWFTANASHILEEGQVVYLEQTGTYKIGDGVTALSSLIFLGIETLQQTFDKGATIVTNEANHSVVIQCGSDDNADNIFQTKNKAGDRMILITGDGKLLMLNVPTSSAGLTSGTVWSDGGTLKIV